MSWGEHLTIGAVSVGLVVAGVCFVPLAWRLIQFVRRRR